MSEESLGECIHIYVHTVMAGHLAIPRLRFFEAVFQAEHHGEAREPCLFFKFTRSLAEDVQNFVSHVDVHQNRFRGCCGSFRCSVMPWPIFATEEVCC